MRVLENRKDYMLWYEENYKTYKGEPHLVGYFGLKERDFVSDEYYQPYLGTHSKTLEALGRLLMQEMEKERNKDALHKE